MAFIPRYDRISINITPPLQNETNLAEMIVDYLNFINIAQNLFCDNEDKFKRFFEKLYNLDRRALALFIRHYKHRMTINNTLITILDIGGINQDGAIFK